MAEMTRGQCEGRGIPRRDGGRWAWCAVAAALLLAASAYAAERHVGAGQPYTSIQSAIDDSAPGDTVTVHAGTYTEPQIVINRSVTVRAAPGEARPHLAGNVTSHNYAVVSVTAAGAVFSGVEVTNEYVSDFPNAYPAPTTGRATGYLVYVDATAASVTIDDCVLHHGRHGIYAGGDDVTITHCDIHDFTQEGIWLAGPGACTVKANWIHDTSWFDLRPANISSGQVFGILLDSPRASTGTSEVSFNYISGTRSAITYRARGDAPASYPASTLILAHNTIDGNLDTVTDLGPPLRGFNARGEYAYNTIGISIFRNEVDTVTFNAADIVIRDNLIANCAWYGLYAGEGAHFDLVGDLPVTRSLFWNNYWNDAYWPGTKYPEEWPGARGEVGWSGYGADFLLASSLVADPQFIAASPLDPEIFYSLAFTSPAYKTASDGLNIGAWQDFIIPEPATGALLLATATLLARRRRPGAA